MKASYQSEELCIAAVAEHRSLASSFEAIADYSAFSLKVGSGGAAISCMEGFVWITQENDRKDYFLERGGRFKADRAGTLVVQSMAYRVGTGSWSKIRIEA